MNVNTVLLQICSRIEKFDIIVKAAQYFSTNEVNTEKLSLMASLILKSIGTRISRFSDSLDNSQIFDVTVNNSAENDLFVNTNNLNGLKLCQKIVSKALVNATESELQQVIDVMNWASSCFYITNKRSPMEIELFKEIYSGDQAVPNESVYNAIRDNLQLYIGYIGNYSQINNYPYIPVKIKICGVPSEVLRRPHNFNNPN